MNDAEIRQLVFQVLSEIAPEADPASIGGDEDMRETLDLDSMDFLNFVIALHKRSGVEIPESDYSKLVTLDGAIAYLRR